MSMEYIKIGNPSVLSKLQDGGTTENGDPILLYNGHIVGMGSSESSGGLVPSITATQTATGYILEIVDQEHPNGVQIEIHNGADGSDGADGTNGTNGSDGVSPVISVSEIEGGHRVTIVDATHPLGQTFDVMDGSSAEFEHSHDNMSSLNKISEKSGNLAYNGKIVGIQVTSTIPSYNSDLEAGRIIYYTGQSQNPFSSFKDGLMYYDRTNGGWLQLTRDEMCVQAHDHSNIESLNRISERNGILSYRNKSIHDYMRDLFKAFTAKSTLLYANSDSNFVDVDSNNQLYVDESTAANINDVNYLEVII